MPMADPELHLIQDSGGAPILRLTGHWTLQAVSPAIRTLGHALAVHAGDPRIHWDLRNIGLIDSAGAWLIWRAWGRRRKPEALLRSDHEAVFQRLERLTRAPAASSRFDPVAPLSLIARYESLLFQNVVGFVALIGWFVLDLVYLLFHPSAFPWKEVSASIYKAGARALPVTALVGFLIGVVVSYLSALTLRTYGAGLYIIDILGISIIRELGPLLAAILIAGRSGSAMTAQIGVMRVTEEIDAMVAMGMSPTLRLVLPKVLGLALAMPLISAWVIIAALAGGWLAAYAQLGISFAYFFDSLPNAVHHANLWIALLKGVTFGATISLVACHFGLRVKPNTESVSAGITSAVVTSITLMILIDALYAILFRDVGFFTK
jgi:phospholipid/cholesterol/gamma-HCH transport system permease protein